MCTRYRLRFFFDWGCYPLWAANDAARARFGYAIDIHQLPLSAATRARILRLCEWFDAGIDWANAPEAIPRSREACEAFNREAEAVLALCRAELGEVFSIRDEFQRQ